MHSTSELRQYLITRIGVRLIAYLSTGRVVAAAAATLPLLAAADLPLLGALGFAPSLVFVLEDQPVIDLARQLRHVPRRCYKVLL